MTKSSAAKIFKGAIMGPPGSGKGTISNRIMDTFDIVHISTGDILRQNINNNTELGQEAEKYISDGKLVPDSIVNKIVMFKIESLSNKNLLLDGYPRTQEQAENLFLAHPLDLVISLIVPKEVILERLQSRLVHVPSGRVYNAVFKPPKVPGKDDLTGEPLTQRPDDQTESVMQRLQTYAVTTFPLLQFYEKKRILKEFSGTSTDAIWPKVEKELGKFMTPKH